MQGFALGLTGGMLSGCFGAIANSAFMGAVAAGALMSVMSDADPVMGALTAGISAGVAAACSIAPIPSWVDTNASVYLWELAISTGAGAFVGGVTTEISGGDFAKGAAYGAASAAANRVVIKAIEETYVEGIRVRRRDASTIRQALTDLKTREPKTIQFLQDLADKGLTIRLFNEDNGYYDPQHKTVSWNPKFSDMFPNDPTAPTWSKVDPEVVLGHELVHAYHFNVEGLPRNLPTGYSSWSHYVEYRAVGLGQFAGTSTVSENTLRQAYGNNPRSSYYKGGWPF